jgi:hypothetical protein
VALPSLIEHPNIAIQEYVKNIGSFDEVHRLLAKLEQHLDLLYFQRTEAHLLYRSTDLPKAQGIRKLFEKSPESQNNRLADASTHHQSSAGT